MNRRGTESANSRNAAPVNPSNVSLPWMDESSMVTVPFEQSEIGMCQVDEEGLIVRVNQRFCSMLRIQETQCIGQPILDRIAEEDRATVASTMIRMLQSGASSQAHQVRMEMGKAPEIWANLTLSPVRDDKGLLIHWLMVFKDITMFMLSEQAFQRQHTLFALIMQTSPVGLMHLKMTGEIGFSNPEANRMFGMTEKSGVSAEESFERIVWHLKNVYGACQPYEGRPHPDWFGVPAVWMLQFPDGRQRHVSIRGSQLDLKEDGMDGSVLVLEDVTAKVKAEQERERLNGELSITIAEMERINAYLQDEITTHRKTALLLEASRREAMTANEAKSRFLANMSHELRTPMNGILGLTEMLQMSEKDPEHRESLEWIRQSGSSLLRILNDILDYSRIESDSMPIMKEPVVLRDWLDDLLGPFRISTSNKALVLETVFADDLPLQVQTDGVRLRQILDNLLGNAVKFTRKGTITLRVVLEANSGSEQLRFTVRDTGNGIPPELRVGLFERFNQLDNSLTKKYQGTGLGLAISKQLAEKLGGMLWIDDEVTDGCAFHVTLPLEKLSMDRRMPP